MKSKIEKFEDLSVWQNAIELSIRINNAFRENRDYGFKDQVCRAFVSVPSNIAKGYEQQTNKEFIQLLFIAKGSTGELRTQLQIARHLNYLHDENFHSLLSLSKQISAQLYQYVRI